MQKYSDWIRQRLVVIVAQLSGHGGSSSSSGGGGGGVSITSRSCLKA